MGTHSGYDSLSYEAVAKNVMSIGAVNDAEFHLGTDPQDTGSVLRLTANRPVPAGTATVETASSPWTGTISRNDARNFFRLRYDPPAVSEL